MAVEHPYPTGLWSIAATAASGRPACNIAESSSKKISRSEQKRRRRRSAIEPNIGHLKSDHRAGRCFLSGLDGDAINIILAAAACNLRKLMGAFRRALRAWLAWFAWPREQPEMPRLSGTNAA